MLYTIRNDAVSVTIESLGAELRSITSADGTDYLWYGDETYWRGRAPVLFPYVGRNKDGKYTLNGRTYSMGIHGFARHKDFSVKSQQEDRISLVLQEDEDTLTQYPFPFVFVVTYALEKNTIQITFSVENTGGETMFFGIGGHPGFRLPLEPGLRFEDYRLDFSKPCHPSRVELSDDFAIAGRESLYPLEEDRFLSLRHDLFDHDAVILRHMDRTATLRSPKGTYGVTVSVPQMQYLALWHAMQKEAPFVCLEPWVSLPARHGVTEELSQQADLIHLPAGEIYENHWGITVF